MSLEDDLRHAAYPEIDRDIVPVPVDYLRRALALCELVEQMPIYNQPVSQQGIEMHRVALLKWATKIKETVK